jgi:hypothetical protein
MKSGLRSIWYKAESKGDTINLFQYSEFMSNYNKFKDYDIMGYNDIYFCRILPTFVRNVDGLLPNYRALELRRSYSS